MILGVIEVDEEDTEADLRKIIKEFRDLSLDVQAVVKAEDRIADFQAGIQGLQAGLRQDCH